MKYVIIGNSTAGVSAVEGIRSADAAGEIVVISEERFPVYGRPLISYYLLSTVLERTRKIHNDFNGNFGRFYQMKNFIIL